MPVFFQSRRLSTRNVWTLLFAMLLLGACKTAPYPVGPPEESRIDEYYLGEWVMADSEEAGDMSRMTVLAFDERQYLVDMRDADEKDESMLARVITTEVDDVLIASVHPLGVDDSETGWLIFRVRKDGDRLVVSEMEDDHYGNLEDTQSIREVRDYVAAHMAETDFFDDPAVFERVEDE